MSDEPEMTLDKALSILANVHTKEDYRVGFTVESSPSLPHRWSGYEYVTAWKTVRKHLHLPIDPEWMAPA